ncbi:hypothetical protein M2080_05445, partial [Klebsiella pneumoniae]|nr:hypothetical protein [Klebsiella pneumoniae]
KGSAILGCVGCLVGHLFMFLVGGKTPDQSVHLNLTTTGSPLRALSAPTFRTSTCIKRSAFRTAAAARAWAQSA